MDRSTTTRILELLNTIVSSAIIRTTKNLKEDNKPFHKALLSEELIKLSSFERSFSTSFGQKYVEEIARIIVEDQGLTNARQKGTNATIFQGADDQISKIVDDLRTNRTKPNWKREVAEVTAHDKGSTILRQINSDLWYVKDNINHYFSIKTVKPNLDQTRIAKIDMLILMAANQNNKVFFALPYNPTGQSQSEYTYATPFKYFDMKNDPCVLIGKDFWDFIGGEGTYENLLQIFAEAGKITQDQIAKMKL